jgi:hypothetical protein
VSSPSKDGHDRSLENMKDLITVINSKELENVWLSASTTKTIWFLKFRRRKYENQDFSSKCSKRCR